LAFLGLSPASMQFILHNKIHLLPNIHGIRLINSKLEANVPIKINAMVLEHVIKANTLHESQDLERALLINTIKLEF
jgi:hypothetical protein